MAGRPGRRGLQFFSEGRPGRPAGKLATSAVEQAAASQNEAEMCLAPARLIVY